MQKRVKNGVNCPKKGCPKNGICVFLRFRPFQIGCMTDFKVADDTLPIADSPLYRIPFRIFNCLFIRVFRVTILGIHRPGISGDCSWDPYFIGLFCNSSAFLPILATKWRVTDDLLAEVR
jgi:hypothetical protein